MTLRTRNNITRVFTIFTALISISFLILLAILAVNNSPLFKQISLTNSNNWQEFFFTNSPAAATISVILLMLYAPVIGVLIFFSFEKTQSAELLYFTGFLVGCFLESARFLIPFWSLQNRNISWLIYSTHISIFGEIFAILCLLAIGISSTTLEKQDSENTFALIIIITLFFTMIIPINTTIVSSSMRVKTGFTGTIQVLRLFFILSSTICLYITANKVHSKKFKHASLDFLILSISYCILIDTNFLFSAILSFLFLIIFTTLFIKNLHSYYMWK